MNVLVGKEEYMEKWNVELTQTPRILKKEKIEGFNRIDFCLKHLKI